MRLNAYFHEHNYIFLQLTQLVVEQFSNSMIKRGAVVLSPPRPISSYLNFLHSLFISLCHAFLLELLISINDFFSFMNKKIDILPRMKNDKLINKYEAIQEHQE